MRNETEINFFFVAITMTIRRAFKRVGQQRNLFARAQNEISYLSPTHVKIIVFDFRENLIKEFAALCIKITDEVK